MVIGQYNTEGSCPGQNCFWRPQVALLLVTALFGMAWGMAGNSVAKRLGIGVVAALTLFAFLPYGFDRMGMDVRLLLAANIPALLAGWAVAPLLRNVGAGNRHLRRGGLHRVADTDAGPAGDFLASSRYW